MAGLLLGALVCPLYATDPAATPAPSAVPTPAPAPVSCTSPVPGYHGDWWVLKKNTEPSP